jgi:hypothetical protein
MIRSLLAGVLALLLASCAVSSNWYLMDSGYSINPVEGDADAYVRASCTRAARSACRSVA